jgi:hypothetical protein
MGVAAPPAFPFVDVDIDLSALRPVAQRSPGVIAVVGAGTTATAENSPVEISTVDDARTAFGATSTLKQSLEVALLQDPKPSKVYGVRASGTPPDYASALAALEGVDDVTMVALANEPGVGAAGQKLQALKSHVELTSSEGNKRIGFAMVDPAKARSSSYVTDVKSTYQPLISSDSRMVLVAARGAKDERTGGDADVATAAMAAVAGYLPHISTVLKPIRGFTVDTKSKFSPTEIKQLSNENMIPVIDPALLPGSGLNFAEGRCFTSAPERLYIDIVRTLDDIEFRLKAGLIGSIGDARITKSGMTAVKVRTEAILGVLQRNEVIDGFRVQIPVLDILSVPESIRTPPEREIVRTSRQTRSVEMNISITYGPAVHYLRVRLAPTF